MVYPYGRRQRRPNSSHVEVHHVFPPVFVPVPRPLRARRPAEAHIVSSHPEQGWYLLCDGAIVFDDTGALLPDGRVVAPHRVPAAQLTIAA
jgi:hypothetical protein